MWTGAFVCHLTPLDLFVCVPSMKVNRAKAQAAPLGCEDGDCIKATFQNLLLTGGSGLTRVRMQSHSLHNNGKMGASSRLEHRHETLAACFVSRLLALFHDFIQSGAGSSNANHHTTYEWTLLLLLLLIYLSRTHERFGRIDPRHGVGSSQIVAHTQLWQSFERNLRIGKIGPLNRLDI